MKNKNKVIHDPEYISYVENGESAVVFITRDVVRSINTRGKWIDVIDSEGEENSSGRWDFKWFVVELFPRQTKPVYPENCSREEMNYITWQTAHKDIDKLRRKNFHGDQYKVRCRLVNRNKGKTKTVTALWNRTFERFVPEEWKNSSCEYRKRKVPLKPDWQYYILSVEKLSGK